MPSVMVTYTFLRLLETGTWNSHSTFLSFILISS